MTSRILRLDIFPAVMALLATGLGAPRAPAQQPGSPSGPEQEAMRLDRAGATSRARVIWQALIDSAADPAAKAHAERGMAISYAFDGDCASAGKVDTLVIAYWAMRETAEPQAAFFQEG